MGELDGSQSPEPGKVMTERDRKAAKADRKEKRRHRKAEKAEREGVATTGAPESGRENESERRDQEKVHCMLSPPPSITRFNTDHTTALTFLSTRCIITALYAVV